ncbi:MAG TPA: helix-turn-helix transcriptional regulator [Bacteroidia bacterium]|nr:helix-turn-helix transcriptional regulator [Bacteroidia bacterium]
MSNKIGKKIRQLRVISGLSQDNIADEIGMSHGNYGKIERGEIDIDSSRLITLAKVLKVSVGDFFEESSKSNLKESKSEYGFATKDEVADLAHAIIKLTKAVERIEEQLPASTLRQAQGSATKKAVAKKVSKKK